MFNKLQFNNLVISNKKKIQQARLQTINKLVQKIRKLKVIQEKRPEDEKTKQRLRKAIQSMDELKRIKRVEIMKRILLLDKSPCAILTNGLAGPDEIGVAMLAQNKIMLQLLQTFKEQLKLSDTDDAWKHAIMQTSKRSMKKDRTEQKRVKRQALKEQKAFARKRHEWLQGSKVEEPAAVEGAEESVDEKNVSTVGGWKIELIVEKAAERITKESPKILKEKKASKVGADNLVKKRKDKAPNMPRKEVAVIISEKREKLTENVERDLSDEGKANCPDVFMGFQDNRQERVSFKHASPEMEEEKVTHVVDPFFITDSGENYLSTAVIMRGEQQQDDMFKNEQKLKSNINNMATANEFNGFAIKPRNRRERRGNVKTRPRQTTITKPTPTSSETLHPSWAAKQKFKPVIGNFQGTKTTFDDDDGSAKRTVNAHGKANGIVKAVNKTSTVEAEKLHPSWAAKQKLKPTITAFQGKKITFDED